ncbi:MAG: two pore domain potassium channel family protein [Desulfuromusa sp.]|nr:two pore domain potassium channel family protein [Desulfuromusa sp.]
MNSSTPYQFHTLLIFLILMIFLAPLLDDFTVIRIAFDIALSLILVIGCFAVSHHKLTPWIAITLSIPMLLSIWIDFPKLNMPQMEIVGSISGILYFVLIAGVILTFVFSSRSVTWEVISAALVVYLLLGTIWSFGYTLVDLFVPGSFNIADHLVGQAGPSYMYYSFITLTTIGYGDITPISGMARSLSMLEGIIGQTYMAVLVARLVGMHVATSMSK